MSVKFGESGKIVRVNAGFDMSSNTELALDFTKPDGTTVQKLKADGVTLGASIVVDEDLGSLAANEYVEYTPDASFFDITGKWYVKLTYTDTSPTPDNIYIGDCASFLVLGGC